MLKKVFLTTGIVLVGYFFIGLLFSFPSPLNPFFERCLDISQGMEKIEVNNQMQEFINNSVYKTEEGTNGTYGWKDRLSYDTSLTIRLEKEPWYKLDQHPWQCKVLFKNGLVVDVEPFFD